jgi:ABC-type multidrug transport system ATPase subunit
VTEPVVTLSGVSVGFGDLSIVDDLSLTVEPGAFVALVGPNGAGKTTLGELLAGLRAPDAGTVDHRGEARAAAYLPQSPAFRPGFTAAETLGFYATLAGAPHDADRYLSRVGLGGATDRRVEALSGGMTRLLGLAQALVGDPPLVVLDEPTSGLDAEMADHVFDAAAGIAAEGRGVVVVSHDLVAVKREADRVVVLADGAVRADGPPAAVTERVGASSLREAVSAVADATASERAVRPAEVSR